MAGAAQNAAEMANSDVGIKKVDVTRDWELGSDEVDIARIEKVYRYVLHIS